MSRYRQRLPQLEGRRFLTDGGLETTLIFHNGIELPCFAAFDLLKDEAGIAQLRNYFLQYVALAHARRTGIVLETPTWRANADWGAKLGYDARALVEANRRAVELLVEIREVAETPDTPIVISGNIGPRGDGYKADLRMTVADARDYHAAQVDTFAHTAVDMVAAFTMNYGEEAIGATLAAKDAAMPIAIAFTVETDGRLPSGDALRDAIERTDRETHGYPAYYLINCAHPVHFESALSDGGDWRARIRGLRANASKRSHAELDESTDLDIGDPRELADDYRRLTEAMPGLAVLGGCCGTDHRHVEAIGHACVAVSPA